MTPQTPPTDRPLTAGDVPLLREGDVLRVTSPGGSFGEGELVVFARSAPREPGRIYLRGRDYHPFLSDRFTFFNRPATSAASEGVGHGWPEDDKDFIVDEPTVEIAARVTGLGDGLIRAAVRAYLSAAQETASHPYAAALASPPVSERERELEANADLIEWLKTVEAQVQQFGTCTISDVSHRKLARIIRALTAQPAGEGK